MKQEQMVHKERMIYVVFASRRKFRSARPNTTLWCTYETQHDKRLDNEPYLYIAIHTKILKPYGSGWKYWLDCINKKHKTDACIQNASCQTYKKNGIEYLDYQHCTAIK